MMTELIPSICSGREVNDMNEKKFYLPGIIVPAAAILVNLFLGAGIVDLIATAVTFVLNLRKRSTHRIAIGITLAFALLVGLAITVYSECVFHSVQPAGTTMELVMNILFGIPFIS